MKKHIVCFGDSNTHGYCAQPSDCNDGGNRYNEEERWTCLLQSALGSDYIVYEEGLSGRTTVFRDPLHEGMSGLDAIGPILLTHEPVALLVIMLGTNDTKERFGVNAAGIALGLERLIIKAKSVKAWQDDEPQILIISPPCIRNGLYLVPEGEAMGKGCPEKSQELAARFRTVASATGCHFLDAEGKAEFNSSDCMHLNKKGHNQLAEALSTLIPTLLR